MADRGVSIAQLTLLFGVSRKTLYNWLNRWEEQGFLGLDNQKGRGRKPLFNQTQKEQVKQWVTEEPKSLKKVVAKIDSEAPVAISKAIPTGMEIPNRATRIGSKIDQILTAKNIMPATKIGKTLKTIIKPNGNLNLIQIK